VELKTDDGAWLGSRQCNASVLRSFTVSTRKMKSLDVNTLFRLNSNPAVFYNLLVDESF
jgi:hypothetical protein